MSVPGDWTDPEAGNNSDVQDLTPNLDVQLAATKSDGSATYTPGGTGTYTIEVVNNGTSDAEDVTITDSLLSGVTITELVTCTATGGAACGTLTGGAVDASTFEYTNAIVPAGGTAKVTITLKVTYPSDMADATFTNTVTVSDDQSDDETTAEDENSISRQSDLEMEKTAGAGTYTPGGTGSYTLTVTNNGPSDVTAAAIADTLPDGVTLSAVWTCAADVNSSCPASGGAVDGNSVSLDVNIADGETVTVTVPVKFSANADDY